MYAAATLPIIIPSNSRCASRRLGNKALRYNTDLNGPSSPRVSSFNQRFSIASECTALNKRDRLNYEDIWRTRGSSGLALPKRNHACIVEEKDYISKKRDLHTERGASTLLSSLLPPPPFANSPPRNSRARRRIIISYTPAAPQGLLFRGLYDSA